MITYYLAPWVSAFAVGGGRFSLTNPGNGRPVKLSRCLLYGQWNLTPNSSLTINGTTGDGLGKSVCLTRVDQDNATHTLIAADPAIIRLSFSSNVLGSLEKLRFDSTWIQPTTPVREIIRYLLCVLIGAKEMGKDYPETDLTDLWGTLPTPQKNRVISYLNRWNATVNDITNNSPLRTVITKIGRVARGPILLGSDSF